MAADEPVPAGASRTAALPQLVSELIDLAIAYVRQRTVTPLQRLGRYLAWGLLGSLLGGVGVLFLALAGLRALQTETGTTFTGDWSWAPYAIVAGGLLLGGALVWWARNARRQWRLSR